MKNVITGLKHGCGANLHTSYNKDRAENTWNTYMWKDMDMKDMDKGMDISISLPNRMLAIAIVINNFISDVSRDLESGLVTLNKKAQILPIKFRLAPKY